MSIMPHSLVRSLLLLPLLLACASESNDEAASAETGSSTGDGDGDGDGDPGDGDGDPGDGDGDSGDGDGDGDTSCHPLMIDCPTIGTTCTWDGMTFLCSPAMIAVGDSCVPDSPVCVSGFCAPMELLPDCPSTHCCTSFCNLDTPNCQVPGTSCVDYFPDGATTPEVGACLLP